MLLILLLCFISGCLGQSGAPLKNYMNFTRTVSGVVAVNILVSGEQVFIEPVPITVDVGSTQTIEYYRTVEDNIEVHVSETGYGNFSIYNQDDKLQFDSLGASFDIPNPCYPAQKCRLHASTVGTFPTGTSATVYVNGVAEIVDLSSGSGITSVKGGDLVKIKINQMTSGTYGLDLFATVDRGAIGPTIEWLNGYGATHVLIPSIKLHKPVEGADVYAATQMPVYVSTTPPALEQDLYAELTCQGTTHELPILNKSVFIPVESKNRDCTFVVKDWSTGSYTVLGVAFRPKDPSYIPSSVVVDDVLGKKFLGGSSVPIKLTSSPAAASFTVKAKCGPGRVYPGRITSNTEDYQLLSLPTYAQGTNCQIYSIYPAEAISSTTFDISSPVTIKTAPQYVINGGHFEFQANTINQALTPDVGSGDVKMLCGDALVFEWLQVRFNIPSILLFDSNFDGVNANSCRLSVFLGGVESSADSPVKVLIPLTEEQKALVARRLLIGKVVRDPFRRNIQ